YELIASNPPYIREDDPHLSRGDLRFEPSSALASGCDGLDAIRVIAREAPAQLSPRGWLLVEHGWDQGEAVRALFEDAGLQEVETVRDLEERDRVTLGRHGG
ncbi:protein-(glutamine-N5) methyltransferase, release factor-specific, partial [Lysobacter sp. D1-1-M9]|uniref:N5-glutamine methyltransferase family protein n=1 Tax=Novilysobacter longmucuonensis TaxID=3098603 RepID=UPI0032014EEE